MTLFKIKIIFLWLFVTGSFKLIAQKYDQNWILGYGVENQTELYADFIDFSIIPVSAVKRKSDLQFGLSFIASFSDKDGNFLFCSDGCKIYDSKNTLIENGDSINAGAVADIFCVEGYPSDQAGIVLPTPGKDNEYDFITYLIESTVAYGGHSVKLLNHHIINENNTLKVTYKNNIIIQDTFSLSNLMACKHANGRDWWILVPKVQSNSYFTILLDSNGFHNLGLQSIGPVFNYLSDWDGQSVFSPNGQKYARYDRGNDLTIYDFDRCTGYLSNSLHKEIYDAADSFYMGCSIAYSSNSRFLYLSSGKKIYQFDMDENSIIESMTTVAEYDNFLNPYPTNFYLAQLAPDNKIYICSNNSTYSLHIIDKPDIKDTGCDVKQHSLSTPYYNIGALPFYPNYRLGALKGSPCDTLSNSIDKKDPNPIAIAYPNPASDKITLELMKSLQHGDNLDVSLIDISGKLLYSGKIPPYAYIHQIDVKDLVPGMYCVLIRDKFKLLGTVKVVKK